jgi:succinyl-diaminopimelate desuccinylase
VNNPTTNMIPASAKAHFNIRFNTHHTGESLMSWVMAQAAAFDIDAHCTLSAEPFLSQPHALHDIVISAITRVTHVTPQKSTSGGTSDARFAQAYRPVIEFGLVNHTIHQANENTSLQDLHNLQAVYHHVIADFCNRSRDE